MFAEEEWNDDPEAETLSQALTHRYELSESTKVTLKGSSRKRSLLRTLQALGSVPNWMDDTPRHGSGSESESKVGPSPTKRKKKRSKKRARATAAGLEGKQEVATEKSGTDVTQKRSKKPKEAGSMKEEKLNPVREAKDKDPKPAEKNGTSAEERKMSRQQWRNKMKMKRKCKNKYRQNEEQGLGVPKADTDSSEVGGCHSRPPNQTAKVAVQEKSRKDQTKQQKQKGQKAQVREKSLNEEGEQATNGRDAEAFRPPAELTTTLKQKLREEQEVTEEPSCKRPKPEERVPNVVVKSKWEESRRKRALAEKLRRMLIHTEGPQERATEEDNGDVGEGAETAEEVVEDRSATLRARMERRLEAARFRYINEQLYTQSSGEARRMFRQDPQAFAIYHRGFTAQVQHWPANPVDAIIGYIKHRPASLVVADFGCGDCKIAQSVKNTVHSFDLAPVCNRVTVCDMANVPLRDSSVDIAVFCLSLMGTNLGDFLKEANRVLVMGGVLKIAEVASRFENVRSFLGALSSLGFKSVSKDTENSHFYCFEFVKTANASEKSRKVRVELKPCVYKKR